MAGYAACLQVLSALPPRPNRPDKWGRFGLGAFLNAGKNGGAFHRPDNGLAGNLAGFCAGGIKIRKPLSGNGLAKQKPVRHYHQEMNTRLDSQNAIASLKLFKLILHPPRAEVPMAYLRQMKLTRS